MSSKSIIENIIKYIYFIYFKSCLKKSCEIRRHITFLQVGLPSIQFISRPHLLLVIENIYKLKICRR